MPATLLFALMIMFGLFKNLKIARIHYLRYLRLLEKRYHIRLEISHISIKIFKGLVVDGVNLHVKGLNLRIDQCLVIFSIPDLFKNGLLGSVGLDLRGMSIERKRQIYYTRSNVLSGQNSPTNWDKIFFRYFKKLLNYVFGRQIKLNIFDLHINLIQNSLVFEKLSLSNDQIAFDFSIQKNGQPAVVYHGSGDVDRKEQKFALHILRKIASSNDIKFLFDEFEFILYQKQLDPEIQTEFEMSFVNLQIFDYRICPEVLKINNVYLYFDLEANSEQFVFREKSGGSAEEIPFAFSFAHQYCENDILKFSFAVEVSQQLLTSFLTFHNVELGQVKLDGKLVLDLQMMLNITNPLQSYFSLSHVDNSLHITDLGNFDLSILKSSLMDIIQCPLTLENLLPRKLVAEVFTSQVADNFLKVIVATEDPSFYEHYGVNPDSIGYAFVFNMAKKTFSRGASTITMQVARNLFLNSDKNIVRKIEEILIALIIENHFRIPKNRILEIYINIIEFGPGIYGISKASDYYFGKAPKCLSLTESIVLSYIVPRPKHFHDALVLMTPQLLENLPRYFRQISGFLLYKNLISNEAYEDLSVEVVFANELGTIAL